MPSMETSPPADQLISLAEASKRFGLSTRYLRAIAKTGRLKVWRIGRNYVTTAAAVEDYIATREKKGAYKLDLD